MAKTLNRKLKHLNAESILPSHSERHYRAWLFNAYVIIAALIFLVLAFFAHTTAVFSFDVPFTQFLQNFNPAWFDLLMRSVNWMGFGLQSVAIISATIAITFLVGWRWEAIVGALDAAGIWAVNVLIGHIVNRPYSPAAQFDQIHMDLTNPSFPSGHVTSYIGFYGFMCFLIYTRVKPLWLRAPLLLAFGALVVLVGPSRVYMGRHWPSDTLASIFLGTIWLALTIYFYHWGSHRSFVRAHLEKKSSTMTELKSHTRVK